MGLVDQVIEGLRNKGRIEGAGIRSTGQAYGSTLANIGQAVGAIPGMIQQRQQQAQEQEINALRVAGARGDLADKAAERARQEAIRNVLSQHDNIKDAIPELYKVDPRAASEIEKHVREEDKWAEDERTRIDTKIAQKLGSATPETWAKVKY